MCTGRGLWGITPWNWKRDTGEEPGLCRVLCGVASESENYHPEASGGNISIKQNIEQLSPKIE